MLFFDYILHQWLAFIRNERWRRSLFARIMFVFFMAYILSMVLIFSLNMKSILKSVGGNPVDSFNSVLLWYFTADLLMRCMLQHIPSIQVIPYLRLNILRNNIIKNLLFKSIWNVFNLIALIFFTSFAVRILPAYYSPGTSIFYLTTILLMVVLNNYAAVFVGYLSRKNFVYLFIPIAFLGALSLLQLMGFSVKDMSIAVGKSILQINIFIVLTITVLLVFVIIISFRLLKSNFYIDTATTRTDNKAMLGMDKLSAWGEMGSYLLLEINLYMRNKRPRQSLLSFFFIMIYSLFFGLKEITKGGNMGFFFIFLCIGCGNSIYGQFMFSWESTYFDGLMARKMNFKRYVLNKYYVMCALSTLALLVFIITFLIKGKVNPFTLVSFHLFTIGFICFAVMWFATFNSGRIDLSKSQMFNYQGIKGSHFLLSFFIMLVPFGLFLLLKYLTNEHVAATVFSLIGLLFIVTHKWWIENIIIRRFMEHKYSKLEGFRHFS
jgi:hypothetical protein